MAPYPQQKRAPYNSGAEWDIDLPPETVPDDVSGIDIANLFEGLEPPPIHPSAVITVHPDDLASQGHTPSNATSDRSRRTLTDEEIRQKGVERQKRYRERLRQGKADVKKNIDVTAAEIEAERVQQDSLLVKRTVLTKASEYCASTIDVASSLVSNTFERVRAEYNHAVEMTFEGLAWLSLQVYTPSDAQLHACLAKKDLNELDGMAVKVVNRCIGLFDRWNNEPESRENIEAQLEKLQATRFRCLTYLAEARPEIAIQLTCRRLMPTSPDGAPNPTLVEAVATLDLTPEQLESFEREWLLYLQKTELTRQEARASLSFLASSGADESAAAFCSSRASELFLDRLQAVQELEKHPYIEAGAIANLTLRFSTSLTIPQRALLMKRCMPLFPDVVQIGRIVFGDNCGNAVSDAKVQSLPALKS